MLAAGRITNNDKKRQRHATIMKSIFFALPLLFLGCATLPRSTSDGNDWTVLFGGSSTEEWRGYRSEAFPGESWEVRDGILTSVGTAPRIDLLTRREFTNFELALEWRVETGGNSGIFYRVSEEAELIWNLAPEVQILDDGANGNPVHSAGALYDLLPPNDQKQLRPVGEFNTTRLIVHGNQVQHWLNGRKILSYDLEGAPLREKIAQSKFAPFQQFGRLATGPIALQHHGDTVGFRRIRIREL